VPIGPIGPGRIEESKIAFSDQRDHADLEFKI
jgi:hypothetical protein